MAIMSKDDQVYDHTLKIIQRLLQENFKTHAAKYAVAGVLMLVVASMTAVSALIMKSIINDIFIAGDAYMVYAVAAVILVIYTVKGLANYGQNVIMSRIGNNILATNQRRLFDHIIAHEGKFFDNQATGDLTARVAYGAQAARNVLQLIIVSFGRDLFSLLALIIVIISQGSSLALIALLIAMPAIYAVNWLVRKVRAVARQQFISISQVMDMLQEAVRGIRVIKAFSLEPIIKDKMGQAINEVEIKANRIAVLGAITAPLMETLGGFAIAFIVVYGGYSVIYLNQDPGSFFAFITALLLAYEPAKRLARLHITIEADLQAVRAMYQTMDSKLLIKDVKDAKSFVLENARVDFTNVSFNYGKKAQAAITNLSFTANPNSITALVGTSGAGKSTVFSLLERFYLPDAGMIMVDGQDIAKVRIESLRHNIALVNQDTFLFNSTIYDNIVCGAENISKDQVIDAAVKAQADEFINRLEHGYDTLVGEGGSNLSGGQRQRIAIARAILRDAAILLLDEATSSLDSQVEASLQSAIDQLMKGRTTIVIAHRLSTVRRANTIHVMEKGQIVETGTHSSLLKADGRYKKLYDLQFKE